MNGWFDKAERSGGAVAPPCELSSGSTACPPEPVEGSYFVSAYPPFSYWRNDGGDQVHLLLNHTGAAESHLPFGLYAHIPYCIERCQYCYYLSYAGKSNLEIEPFLDGLVQELAMYRNTRAFAGRTLAFVYFGGGTPSLLPAESIRRLLARLQAVFPWTGAEEVTFECAPRSVTDGKLSELREAGVNRVSLGVQQLDDDVLRLNGRVHQVADVEHAYAAIQPAGFDEVNVDLIVGLVGETDGSFYGSLERVIGMGPDSVTIYQLEIPHNTPLYRSLRAGSLKADLPGWETKRARLASAFARLEEAGYTLRSAYAAARNTRHRRFVYQEDQYRGADLLGIGASSFSYMQGMHYQNHAPVDEYLASLREGKLPIARTYLLSFDERLVREFVLQLKLGRVDAGPFRHKFAVDISERFQEPLKQFARQGWLTCDAHSVALTREGLLRVDRMIPAFYLPKHREDDEPKE